MGEKSCHLDYINLCRTCLSAEVLLPIFDSGEKMIIEKIMECTSIQISETDGFPTKICAECYEKLDKAYSFRKKCEETNQFLQKSALNLNKYDPVGKVKVETNIDMVEVKNELIWDEWEIDKETKPDNTKEENLTLNTKTEKKSAKKNRKRVNCPTCDRSISPSHVYRHMSIHRNEKPYACDVCGKTFQTTFNRDRHIKSHTGERPYHCTYCGKGFIQSTTLKTHIRTHTGESPFQCPHCGKKFKQSRLCRLHIERTHINPKPSIPRSQYRPRAKKPPELSERTFACDVCDRLFKTKAVLKAHKHIHGERPFLCSECGKRFVSQAALNLHRLVHTGEKRLICQICQKSFAYRSSFSMHMKMHAGEKRFECQLCGSMFLQSAHLKTHLQLHGGDKPFQCSVCEKYFALKGNLTVHMRIHTGEKPYVCVVCSKGFPDSSGLRRHRHTHFKKNIENKDREMIEHKDEELTENKDQLKDCLLDNKL